MEKGDYMKLLILTQKIDINDDVLGFMHGWVNEFAKYCEEVIVICLYKGEYDLPENVKVLSLGKEDGVSRLKYIYLFYKYIWQERKNYDSVFVHMNHVYVILGGLFWLFLDKNLSLWYNHRYGNIFSKIASVFAKKIYYTSPFSFFSQNNKSQMMPAGIDTENFEDQGKVRIKNSLLYLGRISSIKNVKILVEAVKILDEKKNNFILNIVGEPGENDNSYFKEIKNISKDLEEKGKIKFIGKISNFKTPEIYNENEVFINLTNSGSLDKATLEAMSCGCLVLVSNLYFKKVIPGDFYDKVIFKENDANDLAQKIIKIFNLSENEKEFLKNRNKEIIKREHNLKKLVYKICQNGKR